MKVLQEKKKRFLKAFLTAAHGGKMFFGKKLGGGVVLFFLTIFLAE